MPRARCTTTRAVTATVSGCSNSGRSINWGTPAEIVTPVYATTKFLSVMLSKHPNNRWMSGDIAAICQTVQRLGKLEAYIPASLRQPSCSSARCMLTYRIQEQTLKMAQSSAARSLYPAACPLAGRLSSPYGPRNGDFHDGID